MSLPSAILNEIEKVRRDRFHGARELAFLSLMSLRKFFDQYYSNDQDMLIQILKDAAQAFAKTRPSMASIANTMATVVYEVLQKEIVKESIINTIDNQLTRLEQTFTDVTSNAGTIITDSDTVITCSYSSTIFEALVKASQRNYRIKFFIVSSPSPDGSIGYRDLLHNQLSNVGIHAQILGKKEFKSQIHNTDIAVVGADSILPNGSVVNGSPTLMLAKEAKNHSVPFYIICETWKINALPLLGFSPRIEEGMDKISADLITAFITENGVLDPPLISKYTKEFSQYLKIIL